jgi:hypothetical protein
MARTLFLGSLALLAASLGVPAAALAAAPSPVASVAPGIGMRLLQGPAGDLADPRAHQYIVDSLAPGTTISRQIAVSNGAALPAHVLLYPDAASIEAGAFTARNGQGANELTTWMTMSPSEATIQSGQTIPVTVTIAVPAAASPGERYAAALAELAAPPGAPGGISLVQRVGVRVYLSVSDGNPPASSFTVESLTAGRDAQGNPWVSAQVHNTGGRALDLSGQLSLSGGPAALSAGPVPATLGTTLAIGGRESVMVPLDRQLPAGPWQAQVTLTSGLVTEQASARLTFPTTTGAGPAARTAPPSGSFPFAAAGIAALAVALAGGCLMWRRRRRLR